MSQLEEHSYLEKTYRSKLNFMKQYGKAINASSGSKFDSNANVENKNITTMAGEVPKEMFIGINRLLLYDKITERYGKELAEEYLRQLKDHEIYAHDETSIYPYTYSSKEVVNVIYKGRKYLISLEQLYALCEEDEELVDNEKVVYIKYPKNMSIYDKNGYTKVQRLIRKKRHRDLVRIKTAFGEDLIVTDNHPLIVSDNIDDTIEAIKSLGSKQYRYHTQIDFDNIYDIDVKDIDPSLIVEEYDDFYGIQEKQRYKTLTAPKKIILDEEFGYLIGFILGDGNYNFADGKICSSINITQKDRNILQKMGSIAFKKVGAIPTISYKNDKTNCYVLRLESPVLVTLMWDIFKIGHMAYNKCLPWNIYQTNKDFAFGIIEGLIDSDGTITSNQSIQVRTASRTMVLQLSDLLRNFGFRVANTIQDTAFGNNDLVQQKYQIFGVTFSENENTPVFNISYKAEQSKKHDKGIKYKVDNWINITNVDEITNEKFLEANNYIYDITTESHSFICNNIWVHNCVAITMYPFLFEGAKTVGGKSEAPKHLQSFCGSFINLAFAIAAQFAGAVATPEFLMYMDYFIRKEYGDDYYLNPDKIVDLSIVPKSLDKVIVNYFEQVVYSLNEPAGARSFQSIFWNIAYFDEPYFRGLFENFVFPDGSEPKWESLKWLQKRFMNWFNQERLRSDLTFPVETMNLLCNEEDFVDQEMFEFTAEMYAKGHSFFTYISDSVDSLSSCCRLRNEIKDNEFSYTLGAGGVSTGSKGVMTININRLVQNAVKNNKDISEAVAEQVEKVHKYLLAYNDIILDFFNTGLLPVYEAGYISLDRQFLTIGINGFVEGAEFLGIDISPNEEYYKYGETILKPIYELNKRDRTKDIMFNCEFIPGENLGVKNAKWDKEDGYVVPRDCYNSYFYKVEDETCDPVTKMKLHGKRLTKYLDGGSANHINLSEHLSKEQYKKMLKIAIKTGCSYHTYNIPNTICNDCGFISKHMLNKCPKCGSENLDYMTRVIGYLKRISKFSEARIKEAGKRYYA